MKYIGNILIVAWCIGFLAFCGWFAYGCGYYAGMAEGDKLAKEATLQYLAEGREQSALKAAEADDDGWVRIDNMTIAKFDQNGKCIASSGIVVPSPREPGDASKVIDHRIEMYRQRNANHDPDSLPGGLNYAAPAPGYEGPWPKRYSPTPPIPEGGPRR